MTVRSHVAKIFMQEDLNFLLTNRIPRRLATQFVGWFSKVEQPLVRIHPRSRRESLFLSSHAGRIVGWPTPEALLFLRELTEHATQPAFVYRHRWRVGDLVMWDNQCTMHRARPFDDTRYPRDLRRTTLTAGAPAVALAQ